MKRKVEALGVSTVFNASNVASKDVKAAKNTFVRNFEHVDGNWPSLVYLTGKFDVGRFASVCSLHYKLSSPHCNLVPVEDPHLSLSKSFVLRSHQIQPFILHLGRSLSSVQSFSTVLQSSYQLFANESQTRLFLALPIEDNDGQLIRATKCVDEVLTLFRQPVYYADPNFHISFASHVIPSENIQLKKSVLHPATKRTIVTVGSDFMRTHQSELSSTADLDDSDEEAGPWGNNIHCETVVRQGSSQPVLVKKNTVLGGLLDGYDSHSDDEGCHEKDGRKEDTNDSALVPALSKVITFNAVECIIGNRLFRLDLSEVSNSRFYEVLPQVKPKVSLKG